MSGLQRLQKVFKNVSKSNRASIMPFLTIGYPDFETSVEIVLKLSSLGVDIFELGIPFSDPIADGPTIQYASQISLKNGVNIKVCLDFVSRIRDEGVRQPILFMGYLNPILNYGVDLFINDAKNVGVDGFIIADLPPEESEDIKNKCKSAELALVFLASPTTSLDRLDFIAKSTSRFLYLVTIKGVTGGRKKLPNDYIQLINDARSVTDKPLVVGFGISTEEQVHLAAMNADGVIIGSALIDSIRNAPTDPVKGSVQFISSLQHALIRNHSC